MTDYLVNAANALAGSIPLEANSDTWRYEKSEVEKFARVGCLALRELNSDRDNLHKIAALASGAIYKLEETAVFEDFDNLLTEFIRRDQALMIASGMDERLAQYFFSDAVKIRDMIQNSSWEFGISGFYSVVDAFAETICSAQDDLSPDSYRSAADFVSGTAIISVNGMADSILGGAMSALSAAYGGTVATKGANGLRRRFFG